MFIAVYEGLPTVTCTCTYILAYKVASPNKATWNSDTLGAGMEISTRPFAHGELKMAGASRSPYAAHPGGSRDVYIEVWS